MTTLIHNRFDATKNFESIEFRQDKVLQSAELIELQDMQAHRQRGVFDALFRDGDVKRDARIVVNAETGAVQAESGAIYLQGAMRGVPPGAFVVPTVGMVNVGIYLRTSMVTELDDPSLLNPANGTPAYQEPGAWRRKVEPFWGYAGDGQEGDFFPVWVVEDGYVRAKEPPPNLDAVTQALGRYDRDSTGGYYIVDGLQVAMAADLPTGEQVYTITEGRARVDGSGFEIQAGRRLVYAATPELLTVDSEPHLSTTIGPQRIDVGRPPFKGIPQARITARKTVTLVHGGFGGAADPLPDPSVIQIEVVKQNAVTFTATADYKLSAGQVDWSPSGAEPSVGSSYEVTYLYIATVVPTGADGRGFTVTGAVPGTSTLVTYQQQLRRIDRLCLNREGAFEWVRGIASSWAPTAPVVPEGMLGIASIWQTWDDSRRVVQDGVRMSSMAAIVGERRRLDSVVMDLAELRLATSAQGVDSGIKKGLFADPFLSDAYRDAGRPQTAAIVRGVLQLPIQSTVHQLGAGLEACAPAHGYRVAISQPMRTGSMLVNPYMAFDPLPAAVTIDPMVDRWTDVTTQWSSAGTERLYTGSGSESYYAGSSTAVRVLSEESKPLEYLRQIGVRFDIAGWGPSEPLATVTFDGIPVEAAPLAGGSLVASAQGLLSGTFTIPPNVSAGAKLVAFTGTLGSRGSQLFTGQGTAVLRQQQNVTTERWERYTPAPAPSVSGGGHVVAGPPEQSTSGVMTQSEMCKYLSIFSSADPLAQTFTLDAPLQCAGVDLRFTAKAGAVLVQLRATSNGVPTTEVIVQARVLPAAIAIDAATRVTWAPTLLQAEREYAIVVLCDDPTTALAVAELGKQDPVSGYVTSQPYQVGVLLSSSNASTWTAHQERDLTFSLLAARYTQHERVVDLGTADLEGVTDLMLLGYAERPSAAANLVFEVQFPAALDNAVVRLADGQIIWLAEAFTGQVQVRARLTGDADLAAVLHPGVQLVAGTLGGEGTYISRTVAADDHCRVVVVYEADIPGGAAVQVHVQGSAEGAPWVQVPYKSASTNTAGVREITHEVEGFAAGTGCRVRLTLTGNTRARPSVRNLRGVVL